MSRVRFAAWNYLTQTLFTVVTLVLGFVSTPLLLRWLGTECFGGFRATVDWYGYLGLLELGLTGAMWPLLARASSRGEEGKVRDVLAAGIRVYIPVVMAMLGAGLVLAHFIPRLVRVRASLAWDLKAAALFMLLTVALLPLAVPFRAVLEARQKSYWVNILIIVQSLTITGASLLFARAGWGMRGQVIAMVIGAMVLQSAIIIPGLGRHRGVVRLALKGDFDRSALREISSLNWPTLALNLCGRLNFLTDNIIVAGILNPAMVVPIVLTQRLASLVQGQLQGFGSASWAGMAELHARGEQQTFQRRLVELTRLIAIVGIAALVPIAIFNRTFVNGWVGTVGFGGEYLTLLACANAFLLSIVSLWGWIFTATGQVKLLVLPMTVQTVLNVGFSVLLTYRYGIAGPVAGTTLALVTVSLWVLPVLLRSRFDIPVHQLIMAMLHPLLLAVPCALGLLWISHVRMPHGWLGSLIAIGLAGLAYLALAFWLVLPRMERRFWIDGLTKRLRPARAAEPEAATAEIGL
jgi:O-antigen/teichoic acid export membrane protein